MKKYLIISSVLFLAPISLFAVTTLKTFVNNAITNVVYVAISLIIALAVLAFFVGVIKFLIASRNGVEEGMTEGKQAMLWSTISIFVIISVFGIIQLAQGVFDMGNITDVNMPSLSNTMFGQQAFVQSSDVPPLGSAGSVGGSQSNLGNADPLQQIQGFASGASSAVGMLSGASDYLGNLFGGSGAKTLNYPAGSCGADTACNNGCISSGQQIWSVTGQCYPADSCVNRAGCVAGCSSSGMNIDVVTGECNTAQSSSKTQATDTGNNNSTIDQTTGSTCPTGEHLDSYGVSCVFDTTGSTSQLLGSGSRCLDNKECQSGTCSVVDINAYDGVCQPKPITQNAQDYTQYNYTPGTTSNSAESLNTLLDLGRVCTKDSQCRSNDCSDNTQDNNGDPVVLCR